MKRLREELNSTDPKVRMIAQVMRRVSPLPPDAHRQRRVRLMLGAPRRRPVFFIPRPAIALGVLLASVAGASAMVGGGWQYARQHITWLALPVPTVTPAPKPAHAMAHHSAVAVKDVAPATVETAPETAAPETAATAPTATAEPVVVVPASPKVAAEEPAPVAALPMAGTSSAGRLNHRRSEPRHKVALNSERASVAAAPRADNATPVMAVPTGPGAELLIEALEARRAGSMTRAGRLLAEYRERYPSSPLQEEALALSLEAASARGDTDAAYDLAREYMHRYPGGRFREHVRQVLKTLR